MENNSKLKKYSIFTALFVFAAILLFPNLKTLGLWESHNNIKKNTVPEIYRIKQRPIPTELTNYLNLEEPVSAKWPPMEQWTFRGASRLPLKTETSSRLPASFFMFLLLIFTVLYADAYFGFSTAIFTGLIFISSSFFFMYGKHMTLGMPWIFFSTLSFLTFISSVTAKTKLKSVIFAVISLILLIFSFLSRGLFLGVLLPVTAVFTGEAFAFLLNRKNSSSSRLTVFGILTVLTVIVISWFVYKSGYNYVSILYDYSDPSITVPKNKQAHAIFTAHLTRSVFSMFPWIFVFPAALLSFSEKSGPKDQSSVIKPYLLGWLLTSFILSSYWELRFGNVLFISLLPVSIITADLFAKKIKILFNPLISLLLLLWSLLLYLNLKEHPYLLAEIPVFYNFKSMQTSPGTVLNLLLLPFIYPFLHMLWKKRKRLTEGFAAWWKKEKISTFTVFVIYALLYPFLKLLNIIFIKGLWRVWLISWNFSLKQLKKLPVPAVFIENLNLYKVFLFGISSVFAIWGAFFYIPALSNELSTANLYQAYEKTASDNEELAVYKLNPNSARIYINKNPVALPSEGSVVTFMNVEKRVFVAVPADLLGKYDHLFKSRKIPYFLPTPPFPKYILMSNKLKKGETDFNPLLKYVSFKPPAVKYKADSKFGDKIRLIGYDYPKIIKKGRKVTVKLHFKVLSTFTKNYKIFIHLDPPYGTRITGDHEPVNEILPTKYWTPGTYVTDEYDVKVPYMGFPAGTYRVFIGLFKGPRLKITEGRKTKDNRVYLGKLIIKQPWEF